MLDYVDIAHKNILLINILNLLFNNTFFLYYPPITSLYVIFGILIFLQF
jgi:hypothetical protein